MRTLLPAVSALVILAASGAASAEETALGDLFADDGLPASDASTERAVDRVADLCQRWAGGREGAGPAEDARCRGAVAAVAGKGRGATAAILEKLDDARTPAYARSRYLELLARTADERVVPLLAKALERDQRREKAGAPGFGYTELTDVLEKVTGANPAERAPWDAQKDGDAAQSDAVAAWRAWADKHQGMSTAEMRRAAVADERAAASDPDASRAYVAASRLAEKAATRAEGKRALVALRDRAGLTDAQRKAIDDRLEELPGGAPPPSPATKATKPTPRAVPAS